MTPGFEFSGIVSAVGKNVRNFKTGDKVFGVTRFHAYATHLIVPEQQLYKLPGNILFEEAGGFPAIYLTAYYALHFVVKIFPGSTILIHSAAGGVGSALLQLCKLAGWRTIGVVGRSHKVGAARAMGADVVIDKSSENIWEMVEKHAPQGVDVILDANGFVTLKEGFKHLKPTGKMISYGFHSMFYSRSGILNYLKLLYGYLRTPSFNPLRMHEKNVCIATFNLSFLFDRGDLLQTAMESLYPWFEEEKIRVPKITTYPFEEVARAHADLQSGQTVGKLVLII
ncbi:MAG: zinc-binding dehydrogenase [Calditrichia bacterium]